MELTVSLYSDWWFDKSHLTFCLSVYVSWCFYDINYELAVFIVGLVVS